MIRHHIAPQLARITPALSVVQQTYELDQLDRFMEHHLQRWFSTERPSGLPETSMVVLKGWALEAAFRVKQTRLELFPSDDARSNAVYLRFLQDNAAMTLSRVGLFFNKVRGV
jgi:hypothetical protein